MPPLEPIHSGTHFNPAQHRKSASEVSKLVSQAEPYGLDRTLPHQIPHIGPLEESVPEQSTMDKVTRVAKRAFGHALRGAAIGVGAAAALGLTFATGGLAAIPIATFLIAAAIGAGAGGSIGAIRELIKGAPPRPSGPTPLKQLLYRTNDITQRLSELGQSPDLLKRINKHTADLSDALIDRNMTLADKAADELRTELDLAEHYLTYWNDPQRITRTL